MTDMSWNLMEEYLTLHTEYGETPFGLGEASGVLNKPSRVLRLDMHRLNKNLALERVNRGIYRTVEPEKWIGITTAIKKFPGLVPFFREIIPQLPHIVSIMLYGSRVRGDFREDSDYDILIVTDGRTLFSVEEEERLRRQGFQVQEGHITELREEIKENPVFIVPVLREAWPIFNGRTRESLLRSFRKENLLRDLREVSRELIQTKYVEKPGADLKRSVVYLSFARGRHLYLIETLLKNKKFFTEEWLDRMEGMWGLSRKEVKKLYRLYKKIESGEKPSMNYATEERLKNVTCGNVVYLNRVIKILNDRHNNPNLTLCSANLSEK